MSFLEIAASCRSTHVPGSLRFQFGAGERLHVRCLWHALAYPPLVRTALVTAIVVGTILTAINQGNVLLGGHLPGPLYWKIPLTFCVPYCVATWSALRMALVHPGA